MKHWPCDEHDLSILSKQMIVGLGTSVLAGATQAQNIEFARLNFAGIPGVRDAIVVDLNGDALNDLAIITQTRFFLAVNDGDGGALVFSRALEDGRGPIHAGDLDGDGRPDIIHREEVSGRLAVTVAYNAGPAGPPSIHHLTLPSVYQQPWCLADCDSDGQDDIILLWKYWARKPEVVTYLSRERGAFEYSVLYRHPENWRLLDVVAGDFDQDGDDDLCAIYGQLWYFEYYAYSGATELRFLSNDGEGGFWFESSHPLPWRDGTDWIPQRVALGDIDGDGDLDALTVAVNENGFGTFQMMPMLNTNGRFAPGTMNRFGNAMSVDGLVLCDLNLDGRLDVVTLGENYWREDPGLWVVPGLGGGEFAPPTFHQTPTGRLGLSAADVSADGMWDLVIPGGSSVLVLRNITVVDPVRLEHSALSRGAEATFAVRRAQAGETVVFLGSLGGAGASRGVAGLGGMTLDLLDPIQIIGSAVADGNGVAELTVNIPPSAPLTTVVMQAVIRRGPGGADSVKTPFRTARILP